MYPFLYNKLNTMCDGHDEADLKALWRATQHSKAETKELRIIFHHDEAELKALCDVCEHEKRKDCWQCVLSLSMARQK